MHCRLVLSFLFLLSSWTAAPGHRNCVPADTIFPDTIPLPAQDGQEYIDECRRAVTSDSVGKVLAERLEELMKSPLLDRSQLGLYVYDLTAEAPLFSHGAHQRLRPASCQKIITAATALAQLGTNYNYRTTLYADKPAGTDSIFHGNIYLRGGFDPMLDAEDLRAFVRSVREKGIRRIEGNLVFDRSMKDTASLGWGWCWDDEEVPLSPLLYEGKATLMSRMISAFEEDSIAISGGMSYGYVPKDAEEWLRRTHNIDQILLPMMKQSDNLFAESLFYQLGARFGGRYPDYKSSARCVSSFLSRLVPGTESYCVADGSGLSLYNYTTPFILVSVLREMWNDETLRRHFLPSLPVCGQDGTLRRRMPGTAANGNVKAKTGTVTSVSSLAGYCTTVHGHNLCFAIINQGISRGKEGRDFQDKVCRILTGEVRTFQAEGEDSDTGTEEMTEEENTLPTEDGSEDSQS